MLSRIAAVLTFDSIFRHFTRRLHSYLVTGRRSQLSSSKEQIRDACRCQNNFIKNN